MFYGTVSSCLVVVTDFLGEVLSAIISLVNNYSISFCRATHICYGNSMCPSVDTREMCQNCRTDRAGFAMKSIHSDRTTIHFKGIWIPPKIRVLSHYPKLYRFSGIFHHNTSVVNRVRPSQFVDNIERPTLLTAMTVTDTVGHDDDRFTIVIKRHVYCILRKFSNDWECCALSL